MMARLLKHGLKLGFITYLAGAQLVWAQGGNRNNPPVAQDDSATVIQGSSVVIPVLANDYDPDGDILTVQNVRRARGVVRILDDGTLLYQPTPNFIGEDSFQYRVIDGRGGRTWAQVRIRVMEAQSNQDPLAADDAAATDEDNPVVVDILANDSDPDEDELAVESVTQGTNGSTAINPDNTVTYAPNQNFNGEDSFTYTVSDGNGGSASADVSITVSPVNDPPVADDQTVSTDEDVSLTITLTASDVDEGDDLTYELVEAPTNGNLSGSPPDLTYTPNPDFNGEDSFTFLVSDGQVSDQGIVTIMIGAANDPPVAVNDAAATDEDTPVIVDVLANDSDPEEAALSVAGATQGANGSTTVNPDNTITYTPNENFNGEDSFAYTVSDGSGGSASADVTITINPVNDVPVAVDDFADVVEDGSVTIPVLDNDVDIDGDILSVLNVRQSSGVVHILDDGTLQYEPTPNFSGEDIFYYTVRDGNGGEDEGMVTVVVGAVNDPPLFTSTPITEGTEGELYSYSITATDPDEGAELAIGASTLPDWLTLHDNKDGTAALTGNPGNDDVGENQVVLTVTDGIIPEPVTQSFTITIENVNDAPVAVDDEALTDEDTPVVLDVLANDSDPDEDHLEVQSVAQGGNGSTVINYDNTVTYTPNENFNGEDSFTYTISDGQGGSASAVVSVTVNSINDPPVFVSDPVTEGTEDLAYIYSITAADPDEGTDLSFDVSTIPAWLTLDDNGDGTAALTGTPGNDNVGENQVVLTVTDGIIPEPVIQSFTIIVENVNDAPVAVNDEGSTPSDTPVTIDVLANDSDEDGDDLTVSGLTDPAHGTAENNYNGTITYTPDQYFSGTDLFHYTVSDGNGGSASATVLIYVNMAGAPITQDIGPEGGTFESEIGASIEIPPGSIDEMVNIQIGTYESLPADAPELAGVLYYFGPSGTTFDPPATITVPYVPDLIPAGFSPSDLALLVYIESTGTWEEALNCEVNTYNQTVTGQVTHFSGFAAGIAPNLAPVLLQGIPDATIPEDTPAATIIESLPDYFTDPNTNDQLVFSAIALDEGLDTLFISQESDLIVIPDENFFGQLRIAISATDNWGALTADTLLLIVTPINDAPVFPDGFQAAISAVMDINEDQVLRINLVADDVDGDAVTFSASSDTSAVTAAVSQESIPVLVVIPDQNWFGTANIQLSATDGQEVTQLEPVTLTVNPINDPPSPFALLEPNNTSILIESGNLDYSLTVVWNESVDPDGEPVSYTIVLNDSNSIYLEYDTDTNELHIPYADIAAALEDLDLISATFWWTVMAISGSDTTEASNGCYSVTVNTSTVAIVDQEHLPQFFALHQNYPNPFNPVTTLRYELPVRCQVLLIIYDVRGREVVRLLDEYVNAGYNKVTWNSSDAFGRPVPSGLYIARLITPEYSHTIKMTLVR